MHGRRLQDSLKEYCGITTEERLSVGASFFPSIRVSFLQYIRTNQEEIDLFENEVILSGIVALPGAMELVSQVSDVSLIYVFCVEIFFT